MFITCVEICSKLCYIASALAYILRDAA